MSVSVTLGSQVLSLHSALQNKTVHSPELTKTVAELQKQALVNPGAVCTSAMNRKIDRALQMITKPSLFNKIQGAFFKVFKAYRVDAQAFATSIARIELVAQSQEAWKSISKEDKETIKNINKTIFQYKQSEDVIALEEAIRTLRADSEEVIETDSDGYQFPPTIRSLSRTEIETNMLKIKQNMEKRYPEDPVPGDRDGLERFIRDKIAQVEQTHSVYVTARKALLDALTLRITDAQVKHMVQENLSYL